jgi:acylphosphatase
MTDPGAVRRRVVVRGRVQGVFFRDTLRRAAEARGVAGWASNRDDGALEAVFEGESQAVEEMVELSRRGPSRAWIESVDVADEPSEGLSGFRVT